ncbi:hypothetical protein GLOIN_2v1869446 [Rhizophagus irregularis DAOM 181602=DAOM 197198]|uniref:Uncharacterized protein n=1 Tax=Rhizophagus irregularis (strain DAOM 181602 / DAOM 197198 / MUCL 43194) TaxID=747089 RepID=A0A2P4QQ41_RHIID|nr:hypothetical protein GLOIN_2v1869446 [Rhizophagus irregularis DAOM 181602=DAOM 197198]POG79764.1 hypothetical protein GLOIN_2v1869446 [Rhizophagus irregularis DAOM 181602=DAOM 197198]|eukprot:XP_025186630.1 hypothetical protein GLOIN_2v1869446 [Rhizophagus irregularis DAOM 181602=DAOM 197198]
MEIAPLNLPIYRSSSYEIVNHGDRYHVVKSQTKISDGLSARVTRIVNDLNTKNNTPEIENIFSKLTAEINTKITNEFSTRLSEVNSSFTAELVRNNNELNKKLTGKIAKINSRDAGYFSEAQNILSMINNIEEDCRNDFGKISSEFNSVRASIEALRNEMIQCYAIAQRLQIEFDQLSENQSEASNRSRGSANSLSVGETNDYALETVRREIRHLTGEKIGKSTVESFYYGKGEPKYTTLMSIMRWV